MNFYQLIVFLMVYSVLGWIIEVIYATIKTGKFINRGFLNGPVCPIYGFGAVAILLLLFPLKEYFFVVLILSFLITSLVEFITGAILEMVFHNKWWDYSNRKCNLKGYICLRFSLVWTISCALLVYVIHPNLDDFLMLLYKNAVVIIFICLYVIFLTDFVLSIIQISKFNAKLTKIHRISDELSGISNKLGEGISSATIVVLSKVDELKEKKKQLSNSRIVKRFTKIFPDLKSNKHQKIVEEIMEGNKNGENKLG